jgi:hypothetical protein
MLLPRQAHQYPAFGALMLRGAIPAFLTLVGAIAFWLQLIAVDCILLYSLPSPLKVNYVSPDDPKNGMQVSSKGVARLSATTVFDGPLCRFSVEGFGPDVGNSRKTPR